MSNSANVVEKASSFDSSTILCPWSYDAALREAAPVYHDKANGIYVVSSYGLVSEVLQNHEAYSSRFNDRLLSKVPFPPEVTAIYQQGFRIGDALLASDGSMHEHHRRIISQAFSRKRLEVLSPLFSNCASGLLDQLIPRGEMKFRTELAEPVAINILREQLRVPESDMPRARQWAESLESGFDGLDKSLDQLVDNAKAVVECQHYFSRKIEIEIERIRQTGSGEREDDLLTLLAQGILDPTKSMDMDEAISFLLLLFPATGGSTAGALTAVMHRFTAYPEVQIRAADDAAFIPKLIEESLRHESPSRAIWRRTARNVTLGGVDIPKDNYILVRFSAANRDDCAFADAADFDPDRKWKRPHLTFGTGIHTCAGRIFARQIITDVMTQLVERAKDFRFTPGKNDFLHQPNLLLSGFRELHISYTARH